MLKALEKLLEADNPLKVGNHSSEYDGKVWYYKYHGTTICEVGYSKQWFRFPYKGQYANSTSTRRAINDYKRYFLEEGFALIED